MTALKYLLVFISKDKLRTTHFTLLTYRLHPAFSKNLTVTTNHIKNHTNVNVNAMQYLQHPQHRTSPSPSATSSANTPTREELQEQNEELKRLLRKYKGLGFPSIDLNFAYFCKYPRKAEGYRD
jgi:hypothetical protein